MREGELESSKRLGERLKDFNPGTDYLGADAVPSNGRDAVCLYFLGPRLFGEAILSEGYSDTLYRARVCKTFQLRPYWLSEHKR